jgi:hypothetical protein
MAAPSRWKLLDYTVKYTYLAGYRYLDRCGEFMVRADRDFGFVPKENATPTGASLICPEKQMECNLNGDFLQVIQHHPKPDNKEIRSVSAEFAELAWDLIQPEAISLFGCAVNSFLPYPTEEAALKASLSLPGADGIDLDMPACETELKRRFRAGSRDLAIHVRPVSLRQQETAAQLPRFDSTRAQRERLERLNRANRLSGGSFAAFGIYLSVDLREYEPGEIDLANQFRDLLRYQTELEKRFESTL